MPENLLQLNDLRLTAQSKPVDLRFEPGQIAVVLGRNNSGKTNLLRAVAGLETRAGGEVLLDGDVVKPLRSGERPVGYVFQAFVNYPHWSVRQNIESPMRSNSPRAKRLKRAERKLQVERIAETLQLTELLDRTPAELSGGQQQRLAIGRALASSARVLLLDEPFVNLDFRLRERLTEELAALLRNTGTTALFASSDCRDAFALGDSVSLLADQEVLQSNSPLEAYRNPVSLEAAHLMSEPAVNWYVKDAASVGADVGEVEVVRPEHMKLALCDLGESLAERDALQYRLRVESVETSGSHTFLQGELVSPEMSRTASRWVARLDGMPDLGGYISAQNTLLLYVDPRNLLKLKDTNWAVELLARAQPPMKKGVKDGAT